MSADRIAALEHRLAGAERAIADLQLRLPPIPRAAPALAPVVEPQTIVTYPETSVVMPTAAELKTLAEIVLKAYPEFGPRADDVEAGWRWEKQFENAFRAIARFGREDGLNAERYVAHWIEQAEDFLRAAGRGSDISFSTFMAAALAAGDIPHNFPKADGEVVLLGLAITGSGRPADPAAWRRVLRTKQLRPRTVSATRRAESEGAPRVVFRGGDKSMFGDPT
jgi:hypothetical protein